MQRSRILGTILLLLVPTTLANCSSSSPSGGTAGTGGASTGNSGASATSGDAGAGRGGASAGSGGHEAGKGGASASGGNSSVAGQSAGGAPAGLGDLCAYTDLTSKLNALDGDVCATGHCLWDGRYFGESYCTVACTGSNDTTCGAGYGCTEDQGEKGKYWCARNKPMAPSDLGDACTSQYLSDCTGASPRQNFCLAPAVDSCENKYCVYDGVDEASYCATPCNSKNAPCPDGWDCWRNPSGSTGVIDTCVKHHDPAELVGRLCYHGTPYMCESGMPCATTEQSSPPNCAPEGGYCVYDLRSGVTRHDYCSMLCDTATCPSGYTCTSLPYGVNPLMLCVEDL